MDENLDKNKQNESSNNPDNNQQNAVDNSPDDAMTNTNNTQNENVKNFSMDNKGNIHTNKNGTAAIARSSRTFIILGWISAAFTLLISPYFAIAGIVFGLLANRQAKGSGNVIIITNVVIAVISLLFGLLLFRGMIYGY